MSIIDDYYLKSKQQKAWETLQLTFTPNDFAKGHSQEKKMADASLAKTLMYLTYLS